MKQKKLLTLLVLFLSLHVNAGSRFAIVDFSPHVTIHQNATANSLEIVAQDNYSATYNVSDYTFEPLKIEFQVISTGTLPERHSIEYVFQSHHCQDDGGNVETPIEGVELFLNGRPFSNIYEYDAYSSTINHTLVLNFPFIRPHQVEQICYGIVGFTLRSGML